MSGLQWRLVLEQVVVAEGAPRHGGQELAWRLAQAGLHTTLIPDSAIFAMMARVNKVSPHALLLLRLRCRPFASPPPGHPAPQAVHGSGRSTCSGHNRTLV